MDVITAVRTGRAYLEGGAPMDALRVLDTVSAELADDPAGQLLLARAYFASAQLARAEAALQRVLARDPVDAFARLLLARTLERASRPEEALAQYRLAAALQPDPDVLARRDELAARLVRP